MGGCPVVVCLGTHLPEVQPGSRLCSVPKDGGLWAAGGWLPGELRRGEGTAVPGELFSKLESTQFKLEGIVSVLGRQGGKPLSRCVKRGTDCLCRAGGPRHAHGGWEACEQAGSPRRSSGSLPSPLPGCSTQRAQHRHHMEGVVERGFLQML